jgi:hypothetical protein
MYSSYDGTLIGQTSDMISGLISISGSIPTSVYPIFPNKQSKQLEDSNNINFPPLGDDIKMAVLKNDQIEENLHVIIVISNPCNFKRRYELATQFINRMKVQPHVILYVVELVYGDQEFKLTSAAEPTHLQLRGSIPLWHKENMINLGVKKLLPASWKAFAWIDADIEFDNIHWAEDTLKILNGSRDIVQLFTHAVDMDANTDPLQIFQGFGYQYDLRKLHGRPGLNFWHPGYAWACTRQTYEQMGGIYEKSILGAGDHNMALCLIGKGVMAVVNQGVTDNYKQTMFEFESRVKSLKLGYVPGVIRHFFHGSKRNRKYMERWKILVDQKYDPTIHITTDANGLLIPTEACPPKLLADIMNYFKERNEDE